MLLLLLARLRRKAFPMTAITIAGTQNPIKKPITIVDTIILTFILEPIKY